MSTAKRSRQRTADPRAASPLPASKRLKSSHTKSQPSSGLGFLVDEDARAGRKLKATLTNGVPQSKSTRVDDSRAAVTPGDADSSDDSDDSEEADRDVIELSSNSESSDDDEEEEPPAKALTNGHHKQQALVRTEDTDMTDAADVTFGDLLQARHPEPIDVQKALQTTDASSRGLLSASGAQARTTVTPASLGVVLAQALKTKDRDLLEDCFRMNDHASIRATIQRQQSHQVATLLECIAERIHKRPGRTGKLMTWVQWSLVSHGGYLANQPELMKKLKSLGAVVRERANGLQPLLHLKGKLDLLSAQLELRRETQAISGGANADDLDDAGNVLYIEGQDQDWSDSDDEDGQPKKRRLGKADELDDESSLNEDDAQIPNGELANGVDDDSSNDSEDDEDADGLLDIEAQESASSNEEADTDASEDEERDDESGDDESEEVEVKQPKHSTLNRKR